MPTAATRAAVTMIELLVVISIMAILAGMISRYEWVDDEEAALNQAAIELRATIRKARSLAMRENKTYAITFNLESPGNGEVIRNFDDADPQGFRGRHWYAIVAPATKADTRQYSDMWMPPTGGTINGIPDKYPDNTPYTDDERRTAFMEIVERHLVGPRHYLPRKVRFLALSDIDGGADHRFNDPIMDDQDFGNWGRSHYGMVYPVPWFGAAVPDAAGVRLVPWGFHDDTLARWGLNNDMSWRGDHCGTRSAFGAGADYPYFQSDGVTRLTEGLMMDAYLEFSPDGRIAWKHTYGTKRNSIERSAGSWTTGGMRLWSSLHRTEITGGFHITLARDVDESEPIYVGGQLDRFANERDALASITPFARVFVHERSGQTEVRPGLPKAPRELHWTLGDGTVQGADRMGATWQGVDPFCRVQQSQLLYNRGVGDLEVPKAYHIDGNPYVSFKPAGAY